MKVIVAAIGIVVLSAGRSSAPAPRVPVLVELFTSEGCSSCPPADQLLARLQNEQPVDAAEIVPVALHVDYWDRLGWKDRFSSAAFTDRQQSYGHIFGEDKVYTPQMVVDGRDEFVGSDRGAAEKTVREAAARPHLPLHVSARRAAQTLRMTLDLPRAPEDAESIQVVAAVTESGLTSTVSRGENRGRTLQHIAVARKVQVMGSLGPDAFVADGQWRVEPSWNAAGLNVVVWLQGAKTRHVYATATAPVGQ
jgi:hypothetical protein